MKFPLYSSEIVKMNLLERWILVHSIIYYEYNTNVVKDYIYDSNVKQLVYLIKKYPESFKKSRLYQTFKEFKGSTGFDLKYKCSKRQPEEFKLVMQNAEDVVKYAETVWQIL